MACPICETLERLRAGTHDAPIAELTRCFVVLGEHQGCEGWCVLLLKEHVEHLDELSPDAQREVFGEVALVARAIRTVFQASGVDGTPPRINYECLGNVVPHVHWHVIPRHADDPTPGATVWGWTPARLRGTLDASARAALTERLRAAMR